MTETVFSSRQVSAITRITQRQLAYWRSSQLVSPSQFTTGGHARYTFTDLIALKTIKQLINAGVSIQRIRKSISSLMAYLPTMERPLTELSLVATGDVILVFHEGAAFEALSGQEWVFSIAEMQRDIRRWQQQREADTEIQGELFPETQDEMFRISNKI